MPRRCRGIRGDVGIAPYEGATGVRWSTALPWHTGRCTPRVLASLRALGRLAEGGEGFPRLRARGTDSHASDIGHWLGMTTQKAGAGNAIHLRQLRFEMR